MKLTEPSLCLDEETVRLFIAGALTSVELPRAEAHLAMCAACRGVVGDAAYGVAVGDTPEDVARPDRDGVAFEPSSHELASQASTAPRPGDVLSSKYRVEKLLGRGGMADVFSARHVALGHRVAVKVLRHPNPTAAERLVREAQACVHLANEHIARVLDMGQLPDGAPYVVMEALTGEDLAQVVSRGPLAPARAVDYVLQVCAALREAHAAGIIHRDLKPANLFLSRRKDGPPLIKVLDFGISKLLAQGDSQATHLTSTGAVVGSPLYMSPEQIVAGDVDARTDIWSLGVILYELITGRTPFRAATLPAISVAIATEKPERPSRIRPDLAPGLELAIMRCLDKERSRRFSSVEALTWAIAPFGSSPEAPVLPEDGNVFPEAGRLGGASRPHPGPLNHNLPAQATPFVGRAKELAYLGRLLADHEVGLITIVGPGGMGKSRLALRAARQFLDTSFPDGGDPMVSRSFLNGIFYVDLAPLSSPDRIVSAIAQSIGLPFYSGRDPALQIVDYLREQCLLLVIDNFEHLLAGASLVSEILQAAPAVKILATSRERLGLTRETVFALTGLDCPDRHTAEDAMAFSSVELFVVGARRVKRDFELRGDDSAHVVRICELVQGMPLGIVLATSWVGVLSPAEIAQELGRSLELLETRLRDLPARQRSIRAVFEHSWNLLAREEREAFLKLSVFRGGFARRAAEDVAHADLLTLARLTDKSLLTRHADAPRYVVHELLRQYGEQLLRDLPEEDISTRRRHAAYYVEFLREREERLGGDDQKTALDEIESEMGNVQVAWTWILACGELASIGVALTTLHMFYARRATFAEAEATFRAAVEALSVSRGAMNAEHRRLLGMALGFQAKYCGARGEFVRATNLFTEALGFLDEHTHAMERASTLVEASLVMANAGNLRQGIVNAEEALDLYRRTGNPSGIAWALARLGSIHSDAGDYINAERRYLESISAKESPGNQGFVPPSSFIGLGFVLTRQGRYEEGRRLLLRGLAALEGTGEVGGYLLCHASLADAELALENYAAAEVHVRKGLALAREVGHCEFETLALYQLGHIHKDQQKYDEAVDYYQRGYRRSVETRDAVNIAIGKLSLGGIAAHRAEYGEAKQYLSESLSSFESYGVGWGAMMALNTLGAIASQEQDDELAASHFRRALEMAMATNSLPFAASIAVEISQSFARNGRPGRAVELLSSVQEVAAIAQQTRRRVEQLLDELRAALPVEDFATAVELGKSMPLKAAVHEFLDLAT